MKGVKYFSLVLFLLLFQLSFAQPTIEWQQSIGGGGSDFGKCICMSKDSSAYYVAGYTNSNDGSISGYHAGTDIFVCKLDLSGNIKWTKAYGGMGNDFTQNIIATQDNRLLLGGFTFSSDSLITGNHGGFDALLIEIDTAGNVIWQHCYGGSGDDGDHALSVTESSDSSFVVITGSNSNDGDVSGNHGSSDFWLFKINKTGNMIWEKCYGGTGNEDGHTLLSFPDGGYIFAGHTASNDDDVSGLHSVGYEDGWVVRVDTARNILWQKCIGGSDFELISKMQYDVTGVDYFIAGYTKSNDGDITGNNGDNDIWVVKMDTAGNMLRSIVYGGTTGDYGYDLFKDGDGNFVVGAFSNSVNGNVSENHGNFDYWVFKMDTSGGLIWQQSYGGSGNDRLAAIYRTPNDHILMTGFSNSTDDDISINHGINDAWTVKLDCVKPTAGFISSDTTFCVGTHIFFINTSFNATSFQWFFNDSIISNAADCDITFSFPGNDTISLIAYNKQCLDTVYEIIHVFPYPLVYLGADTALCSGCSITLDAGNPGSSYLWSTGESLQQITVNYLDTFIVTVTNSGCASSDTIIVSLITDLSQHSQQFVFRKTEKNRYCIFSSGNNVVAEITDVSGQILLYTKPLKEIFINLESYPEGIYFLTISDYSQTFTYKLFKE
jgi:hypothetical protein